MSIRPIVTFKAGICDLVSDTTPPRFKPRPTPGYIYLYSGEDELVHFCWRARSASVHSPELDLVMIPGDGKFQPYHGNRAESTSERVERATNGRIFALKFSSSSQRHLFWMQSKGQSPRGDPSYFGPRDMRLGILVDQLLQGEEVDVTEAVAEIRGGTGGADDDDDDEAMEDVEGSGGAADHHAGGSGGAGAGATGGDIREEGEESREGGADGGRAAAGTTAETSALVQDFLDSLKGGRSGRQQSGASDEFTTLSELLTPKNSIPVIEAADEAMVDHLLSYLPSTLSLLAQEVEPDSSIDASSDTARAPVETLCLERKKEILRRVLHSPQLTQSLASLTVALRDGGLPTVSEALGIKVKNGGCIQGGSMPLAGGEAVAVFVDGVKTTVEEESREGQVKPEEASRMETD